MDWSRVRALYERALDLPARERRVCLEAETDAELRRTVLELLVCAEIDDDFLLPLELPPTRALQDAGTANPGEWIGPGERIGAYRLVRLIGAGGMGSVFEAVQERPARRVALKVVRRGLRSSQAARRFQLEAEALGRLQHPGIAAIFEAGVHRPASIGPGAVEVPYFAMELVEGARDLVEFARAEALTVREKVELLLELCAAVHHGHQKGVIHRDLKPGNVLVDAEGRVKVIDYGVARVADPEGGALETRWGALGTLPYMSPEQVRGDRQGIDVRTDVYALGAILFELLTGRPPHDITGLPLAQAIETLASATPRPPSTLVPDLPLELDWIALRALEPDRERRYGSALELEQDLRRHLRDEPVQAGSPTALYRLGKLYRRHRIGLSALAAVLLALLTGLLVSALSLVRALRAEREATRERVVAERQGQRAEETLAFLVDSLTAADPRRAGRELKMTDFLERAAERIDARFAGRPELRGYLHGVVGRAWAGLGELEPGERHLAQALELMRAAPDPDPAGLASALGDLAVHLTHAGRYPEARAQLDEAEQLLVGAGLGDSAARHKLATSRAWLDLSEGRREGVEASLRAAIAGYGRTAGASSEGALAAQNVLAGLLQAERRFDESEALCRELLPTALEVLGPEAPETLRIRNNLVTARVALGDQAGAIEELEALLEARTKLLGEGHAETAMTAANLASLYFYEQRFEEASELYADALETLAGTLPAEHPTILTLRANLGSSELRRGSPEGAAEHLREVLRAREATLGAEHERTLAVRYELGSVERALGQLERARELHAGGLELVARELGTDHPLVAQFELELGALCLDEGDPTAARGHAERALAAAGGVDAPARELTIEAARELLEQIDAEARQPR